ncbi:ABC transporter ATP-binding protein/permease [Candidatus Bipolaricaulota bacterium]|nr:ABC transporter ATP-binding protein/permease [Candidatus Bipolaricaulota bacterium]
MTDSNQQDNDQEYADYSKKYLLKRFYSDYLRPNISKYLPIQVLHVLGALAGLVPPLLLRNLIDSGIPSKDLGRIINLSLLAFGSFSLIALIRFARNYFGHRIAQKIVFDMRNDIYGHFQKLPLKFHDRKKTGELMSRIIDDLNVLQEFIHHGPEGFLEASTTISGVLVILFLMNVPLTLIALSFTPFLVIFALTLIKRMHRAFRRNREAKGKLNDRLEDNLAGMKIIKSFANEDYEMERFFEKNEEHYDARAAAIKYFSTLGPVSYFLNSFGLILTIGYGGFLVYQGSLTAGTVVAFYTYLIRFRAPILRMVQISQRLSRFFASTERFFSHLDIEPHIAQTAGGFSKPREKVRGKVAYENVNFNYSDGETVLKDIDLEVDPKQTVALVGPSGAGKTTLVRLIPRLYDLNEGSVKVDDVDVRDWDLRQLRRNIAMVMQDDYLFSGTVTENISYGKPDVTRDEVMKYAREANVEEFISDLPDGYETDIGQRGVKLSGGQKQRISIARALIQNPKILILDEATSSVDTYTEKLIQEAIDKVSRGRTTFTIAHRLSTITNADKILFVENGEITEQGTFEELMDGKGEFYDFYQLQFEQLAETGEST